MSVGSKTGEPHGGTARIAVFSIDLSQAVEKLNRQGLCGFFEMSRPIWGFNRGISPHLTDAGAVLLFSRGRGAGSYTANCPVYDRVE